MKIVDAKVIVTCPGRNFVTLKLVTEDPAHFETIADPLVVRLRELLEGAELEATLHEALEPGPGGKFRAVIALPEPSP